MSCCLVLKFIGMSISKNVTNANCLRFNDLSLISKEDSQGVISNIENPFCLLKMDRRTLSSWRW